MKNAILSGVLISLCMVLFASEVHARDARKNSCSGELLPYNTAKKACKSGDYPGETIVTCKSNGKQKDRRICNSDGEKKGVYVGSCSGTATGYTNLKKACQSEDYFGDLLVKCKKGKEKSRLQCESADEDDDRVVLFKNSCGSTESVEGRNLKKACKSNPGEVLVKCKRKSNIWKEKKSMQCDGKRDRFKIKHCSPTERNTLISDYSLAESRVDIALQDVENALSTGLGMNQTMRNKMEVVRRKLEKIQTAMDRPRTYVCKANKNLCSGANAHTLFAGRNVKICDNYFDKTSAAVRASILVHEISHHKTQTNDSGSEHGGCNNPNLASASDNFQRQAEYYEHLIECGFYIPN